MRSEFYFSYDVSHLVSSSLLTAMGKVTEPSVKESINATSSTMVPDSYDSDGVTLAPSTVQPSTSTYHIWNHSWISPQGNMKISGPDMTPIYKITRIGFLSAESITRITGPENEDDLYATLISHSSSSESDSWIEIRMDARHSPSSEYTIKFHRDGGSLKRKHKMTLSDGKAYVLRGKHSTSLAMCWGNLKIIEEGGEASIAEFKVEWPTSFHKFGTVSFKSEVDDTLARDMLFAFVGVANKEYTKAMAGMMLAVPVAACS